MPAAGGTLRLPNPDLKHMLDCEQLDIIAGSRTLVRGLSLELNPGNLVALLGPNGVGKSLTLATLAGLRAPARGQVRLAGRPLAGQRRRRIARHLGLMLQVQEEVFPQPVLDAALLGRHAHLGLWQQEGPTDRELGHAALRRVDLQGFENRDVTTLSGGEARRLAMARLLVQDPNVMLLDEPTNHLDPLHQIGTLRLLRELADAGKAIIVCLHDPALAARFARSVLLLYGDGRWHQGPSAELLTPANLQSLYGTPWIGLRHGHEDILVPAIGPVACPTPEELRVAGDPR
ncbi:MAG: ABC transporter ATP-binding protein [Chromatiales bacterium]|nr:ABC transporter ATP-binding protein [Chromatiales bacterium]